MQKTSLTWKLLLSFLLVAATTAALVAVFIRLTSADRLYRLIQDQQRSSLQASLTDYYTQNGSWKGISADWQALRQRALLSPLRDPANFAGATPNPGFSSGDHPTRERTRLFGLADTQGKIVVPIDPETTAGDTAPADQLKKGTPVLVNGNQVGTILVADAQFQPRFNPEENLFLQRTNEALIYAFIGALILALFIGILLSRTLIRPLQALTQAAQNIAHGELEQQVTVTSKDEIGQLAAAFNTMSQEVARVNQQRRQMTADIAHDLRTPLTVIAGYVESMQDGVLQPTPQRLALIYTEIERLQNLVGDLKMLSQVDAGELPLHPRAIAPRSLLELVAAPFEHRAEQLGIRLEVQAQDPLPQVKVDEDRMVQVFGNLINNALRYTPSGGKIRLLAEQSDGQVVLSVADDGEGIAEEEIPYIFDRFHRADKSRHAESGESGLGLAIVKALVEAHGGTVSATSKLGEGTTVRIAIPKG